MTEMKAQDIVYIMQTKENIEWNIENAQNVHARYRMEQALHYIDGALKAVEIGKDEKAWFAVDKASYWMQQARAVCRWDSSSD